MNSGNPILAGWYADPDGVEVDRLCWFDPTTSIRTNQPAEETNRDHHDVRIDRMEFDDDGRI